MQNHPEIAALRRVDVLDAKTLKLKREATDLPESLNRRREKVKALAARVQAIVDEQKRLVSDERKLEGDAKEVAESIKKYQVQQNLAKTNEAYSAAAHEIDAAKKKNAAIEDRILEALERADVLKKEVVQAKAALAEEEGRLKADEAEVTKEVAAVEAQIAVLATEREAAVKAVSIGTFQVYRRILEKLNGRALAPVHGRVCQGCYVELPANFVAQLLQGKEVVQCKNCGRILYLEEDYRATTPTSFAVDARGESSSSKDGNW